MTLKEFKRYATVYGANLDRWPSSAASDALALLDHSEEARLELGDAATTDWLLGSATAPLVSADREERLYASIFERIAERAVPDIVPWFLAKPPLRVGPTAGFLALMGVLGFLTYQQGYMPLPGRGTQDLSGVMIVSYLGDTR